jgi:hypothetical protein
VFVTIDDTPQRSVLTTIWRCAVIRPGPCCCTYLPPHAIDVHRREIKQWLARHGDKNDKSATTNLLDIPDLLTIVEKWRPSSGRNSTAPIGWPALPPEEISGVNDLAVQAGRAVSDESSAARRGFRFVGRWAQDANPVTNQSLKYAYQGFTNDGKYLVTFFIR